MFIRKKSFNMIMLIKGIWYRNSFLFLAPFSGVLILLNIWNMHDLLHPNEFSIYFMDSRMMYLIPIILALLLIPSIKCYISESGRELLYINREHILKECILEVFLLSLSITLEYITFYRRTTGFHFDLYLKYIICTVSISGIILCLIYRLKNMTLCVIILFILYILQLFGDVFFDTYSIFSWDYNSLTYIYEQFILFFIGIFCWIDYSKQLKLYKNYDN